VTPSAAAAAVAVAVFVPGAAAAAMAINKTAKNLILKSWSPMLNEIVPLNFQEWS
jgi:hypothetical protein